MADEEDRVGRRRSIRKASQSSYIVSRNAKLELREKVKKVSEILRKPEHERTAADKALVNKHPEIVKTSLKNAKRLRASKERLLEIEDEPNLLLQKCEKLSALIKSSKHVVVYTGAGISTAASIPDYRGPNGVWTLLKKGQELSPQDLSDAEPTFTHMALTQLYRVGKVKYIVSQNCDGLHMRSGFPRHALSEVHGNMFIECCYSCAPHKEFIRLFDVTERTGVHRHATARRCRSCGGNLQDTIVHFGEKGKLKSPYRWKEAVRAAKNSDLILCLGSSLKVLRKYTCLWCMDEKPSQRPKLVVVNLQWTPKDDVAALKINGRCDTVMRKVMKLLDFEVPAYERDEDPIFRLYTPLRASELKSISKKILTPPPQLDISSRRGRKTKPQTAKSLTSKQTVKIEADMKKKEPAASSGLKDDVYSSLSTQVKPLDDSESGQQVTGKITTVGGGTDIANPEKHDADVKGHHNPVMSQLLKVTKQDCESVSVHTGNCAKSSPSIVESFSVDMTGDHLGQATERIYKYSDILKCEVPFVADREEPHGICRVSEESISATCNQMLPSQSWSLQKGVILKSNNSLINSHAAAVTSDGSHTSELVAGHISGHLESGENQRTIPQLVVVNLGKSELVSNPELMDSDCVLELSEWPNIATHTQSPEERFDTAVASTGNFGVVIQQPQNADTTSAIQLLRQDDSFTASSTCPSRAQQGLLQKTLMNPTVSEFSAPSPGISNSNLVQLMHSKSTSLNNSSVQLLPVSEHDQGSLSMINPQTLTFPYRNYSCTDGQMQNSCTYTRQQNEISRTLSSSYLDTKSCRDQMTCRMSVEVNESDAVTSIVLVNLSPELSEVSSPVTTTSDGSAVSKRADCFHPVSDMNDASESEAQVWNLHLVTDPSVSCLNTSTKYQKPVVSPEPAFGQVKNICLDHSYTQNSTWCPGLKPSVAGHLKSNKTVTKFSNSGTKISQRVGVCSQKTLSKKACSGPDASCERKSFCSSISDDIFPSSQTPKCSSNGASSNSVIREHCVSSQTATTSHNLPQTPRDSETENNTTALKNVPSCVLNMDDMEICYKNFDKCSTPSSSITSSLHISSGGPDVPMLNSQVISPSVATSSTSKVCAINLPSKVPSLPQDVSDFELCVTAANLICPVPESACISVLEILEKKDSLITSSSHTGVKGPKQTLTMSESEGKCQTIQLQKPTQRISSSEHEAAVSSWKAGDQTGDRNERHHLQDTSFKVQGNLSSLKSKKKELKKPVEISDILPVVKSTTHLTQADHGRTGRENVCKNVYKRKQSLSTVPGWFGKGLGLKKKKR